MRNIIITGGDDGLGRAIAKLLSERDFKNRRKCYENIKRNI